MAGEQHFRRLDSWIEDLTMLGEEKIFISNENLMSWTSPRNRLSSKWVTRTNPKVDVPRAAPHPVNEFLSETLARLPYGSEVRVILTLRNQTDFLGSLAAQTGITIPNFVDRALETGDAQLEFYELVRDLKVTVGDRNLKILFFEDGVKYNSDRIAEFVGGKIKGGLVDPESRLNVTRVENGVWKTKVEPRIVVKLVVKLNETGFGRKLLSFVKKVAPWSKFIIPRQDRIVTISEVQRQRIQKHFGDNNEGLSALVGRNLQELGY